MTRSSTRVIRNLLFLRKVTARRPSNKEKSKGLAKQFKVSKQLIREKTERIIVLR